MATHNELRLTNRTELGSSGVTVPALCLGTSPLGGNPQIYGYDVDSLTAMDTIKATFRSSLRFLDTSNEYGGGESERRIGNVIRLGLMPPDFVLATKADPKNNDFSGKRVMDSFEESKARLGVETFDVFYLHDPERFPFADLAAPGGALAAMAELKNEGLVRSIGVAGGDLGILKNYVKTGHFDVVLSHNRYTLLDQSANDLIDSALAHGMSFVNAAPYASGLLAGLSQRAQRYQYREPGEHTIKSRNALLELCDEYEVELAAVALQFSMRDARIASTVVGVSHPARVETLIRNALVNIPEELWDLIPQAS